MNLKRLTQKHIVGLILLTLIGVGVAACSGRKIDHSRRKEIAAQLRKKSEQGSMQFFVGLVRVDPKFKGQDTVSLLPIFHIQFFQTLFEASGYSADFVVTPQGELKSVKNEKKIGLAKCLDASGGVVADADLATCQALRLELELVLISSANSENTVTEKLTVTWKGTANFEVYGKFDGGDEALWARGRAESIRYKWRSLLKSEVRLKAFANTGVAAPVVLSEPLRILELSKAVKENEEQSFSLSLPLPTVAPDRAAVIAPVGVADKATKSSVDTRILEAITAATGDISFDLGYMKYSAEAKKGVLNLRLHPLTTESKP